MPKPPGFDLSVIDAAPVEPDNGSLSTREKVLTQQLIKVSDLLADRQAEADRLKGKQTAEEVAAGMMEGAANNVFRFVIWYCAAVAIFLLLSGFHLGGFVLSDTILGIIAGSTAVSVIGLMGMVVTGIFGKALPRKPGKRSQKRLNSEQA